MSFISELRNRIGEIVLCRLPKKLAHQCIYLFIHGEKGNLKNPVTYDEKIHWHIIHTYNDDYKDYADKIKVRDYVKECGLENLLIPIVGGPYNNPDEIDFDKLPNQFVMKTNHASGPNHYYICKDKSKLTDADKLQIRKQFKKALKDNFVKIGCEYHYKNIKPRIYCEQLLDDGNDRMTDYKIVCTKGTPHAILVCSDRYEGRDYYSCEWEYLDYTKEEFRSKKVIKKPEGLDTMLNAAAVLSKRFPVARIDFYDAAGKVYVGEVTLSPSGGNHRYLKDLAQKELGSYIEVMQ